MNYRHAFHAGNVADVVKHVVISRIIERLKEKSKPFRFVDLHAGRGFYDLASSEAERTGEWRDGVGRLYRDGGCEPDPLPPAAEALLAPWRKAIASCNDGEQLARYPGSPEIARRLARDDDRLVFNELHPEDCRALADRFRSESRAKSRTWTPGQRSKRSCLRRNAAASSLPTLPSRRLTNSTALCGGLPKAGDASPPACSASGIL